MTTIKSIYGKDLEILASDAFGDERVTLRCADGSAHNPSGHHEGRMYRRADLLAALDATANADVKHRADAYEAATEAERGEREAVAKAVAIAAERDEWKARAEKAEAAIQRVRDVRNEWSKTLGRSGHVVEIDDALADKPAFTLPTEAGARFEARFGGNDTFDEVITYSSGDDAVYSAHGGLWSAQGIMDRFTDHRLLGADQ